MKNNTDDGISIECRKIAERYESRKLFPRSYSYLLPHVYMGQQEKERVLIRWLIDTEIDLESCKLLEIGCGSGSNLLDLMRLGFRPENLVANELLDDRVAVARERLPSKVKVISGDAMDSGFEAESFDVVLQSTVFTSILNEGFQKELATQMWEWVKPGGGVLWYDFIYDNPKNPDVRGVKIKAIQKLFPESEITINRLTLAPPIARVVTKWHPRFYDLLNIFPFLRTHVLCWIEKI